jgi:hypothetical protein|tara:strand:+ start:534 stop:1139 length:606 start_codon:yes stop_codon:yes gene_type:complete
MAGIQSFKSRVAGDFSRPNLFKCVVDFPTGVVGKDEASKLGEFTVRAANLPATQLGIVEVPYRGRVLKIAGDRTFEPWTITIMNDKNFVLRNAFESWAQGVQEYTQNVTTVGTDVNSYFKDMRVIQYDRFGDLKDSADAEAEPNVLAEYRFYDTFPTNVAAIDLDYGSNDAISEFTVELQVQYWKPVYKGEKTEGGSQVKK